MKHPLKIVVVIFACCLSACSFIARTANHARKPRIETPESVMHWLQNEKIHIDKIFTVDPSMYLNVFPTYCQGAKLFNEKGQFVSVGYNADTKFCPKGVKEFLSTLTPGFERNDEHLFNYILYHTGERPDTLYPTLERIYSFSRDMNGNELAMPLSFGVRNYTLVIPFAIFMGDTFQTSRMRALINSSAENPSTKIEIILVNFDKQAWWGKDWNNKIKIKV